MNEPSRPHRANRKPLYAAMLGSVVAFASPSVLFAASNNPCAARKPCAAARAGNPCAAKRNPCNPCAAKRNPCNPCAAKRNPCNPCAAKRNPCNPCAAKNPCNPCSAKKVSAKQFLRPAGYQPTVNVSQDLLALGQRLWNNKNLGKTGLACQSCHNKNALFNATFAQPYPHKVAMASGLGAGRAINLDEMIQLCMLVPMKTETLKWGSTELAALTAYASNVQKTFKPNPCAAKGNPCNPCAAKGNPCNPCAAKRNPCNPCAAKRNPCNPCAAKRNPCNPCAAKRN